MPLTRKHIAEALTSVIDPEVGINIVDLGLVYDIQLDGGTVFVKLTMTTPACPLSSYITSHVETALGSLPGVDAIRTELVWTPPWSPRMIRPEVRERRFGPLRRPAALSSQSP